MLPSRPLIIVSEELDNNDLTFAKIHTNRPMGFFDKVSSPDFSSRSWLGGLTNRSQNLELPLKKIIKPS